MVDYVSQQNSQEILAYNDQLARGGPAKMSDSTIEAYSRTLGIENCCYIGRRVDDSFKNAPDYMKDGNHVVSGQGLYIGRWTAKLGKLVPMGFCTST